MINQLREKVPPRRTADKTGTNRDTPAWRVNADIEGRALKKAFQRHGCKTEDEQKRLVDKMLLELEAQTRYRRNLRQAKQFVPQPRQLSVWLNQDGWCDEFEHSNSDLKEARSFKCVHNGCLSPGEIPYNQTERLCRQHYDAVSPYVAEMRGAVRKYLNKTPRGDMTWREWAYQVLEDDPQTRPVLRVMKRTWEKQRAMEPSSPAAEW